MIFISKSILKICLNFFIVYESIKKIIEMYIFYGRFLAVDRMGAAGPAAPPERGKSPDALIQRIRNL